MKCSRCSAEIPAQSQFCLRCGTPVRGNAPSLSGPVRPTAVGAPQAAPRSNRNLMLGIMALLVLAVLSLGAVLIQKSGKSDNGKLVAAPANAGPGSLVMRPAEANPNATVQAPAEAHPNAVVQQPDTTQPFPADIDDYLKHVKETEKRKIALISKELGNALVNKTNADALHASIDGETYNNASTKISKGYTDTTAEWNNLAVFFNSKTPPQPCIDLRDKYLNQLGKVQGMVAAIHTAFNKGMNGDGSAVPDLTGMMKFSQEADQAFIIADDSLADVCDKYRLKKDFTISGESGGSSLLR